MAPRRVSREALRQAVEQVRPWQPFTEAWRTRKPADARHVAAVRADLEAKADARRAAADRRKAQVHYLAQERQRQAEARLAVRHRVAMLEYEETRARNKVALADAVNRTRLWRQAA
jgi:hypothetical protein